MKDLPGTPRRTVEPDGIDVAGKSGGCVTAQDLNALQCLRTNQKRAAQ